jgi:hypothetical protein
MSLCEHIETLGGWVGGAGWCSFLSFCVGWPIHVCIGNGFQCPHPQGNGTRTISPLAFAASINRNRRLFTSLDLSTFFNELSINSRGVFLGLCTGTLCLIRQGVGIEKKAKWMKISSSYYRRLGIGEDIIHS